MDAPVDERDALERLINVIDTAWSDQGFDIRPHLIYVAGGLAADDEIELGVKDTEGESVTTAMLGMTAPPEWWAIGHITGGWAAPPDSWDGDEVERGRFGVRPSSHPDSVRIRASMLMSRRGIIVGRVSTADGRTMDEGPLMGMAVDVLRRAFGLATPPPTVATAELLTSIWLENVTQATTAAANQGRSITWPAVARLHPALQLLKAGGHRTGPDDLPEAAAAFSRVLTWTEVRRQVIERSWLSWCVSPELGAWMDEGMLSRWLLSSFPPVERLTADATRSMRPAVAARLRATLAQWPRAAIA